MIEDPSPSNLENNLAGLIALERERLQAEREQLVTVRAPWWKKHIATLIAVAAVVISVVSTLNTDHYNNQQATSAENQQLVTLVDQLSQVPQSQTQIEATYKSQLVVRENLLSGVATAEQIQAEEAGQIIDSLHGEVSSSAARQVAFSFLTLGSLKSARHYITIALKRAPGADREADALRLAAKIEFQGAHVAAGEADYRAAYVALSTRGGYAPENVAENRIYSDTYVFSLEIGAGRCSMAVALYDDATALTPRVASSPGSYTQDTAAEQSEFAQINRACPRQARSAHPPAAVPRSTS